MLEATRQEATGLVNEAKRAAEARAHDLEAKLAADGDQLRARIAEKRDREIAQIRTDARTYAEHLDSLDPDRIEALVQHVLDRLFGRPRAGDGS